MSFYDAIRVGASGASDYEVERSLRFNDGDSPWLERTVSSSSNRRTFTISAWVKRSTLASGNIFGQTDTSGSYMFYMIFYQDSLYILDYDYPTNNYHFVTNRKFRDLSAWYHIVLAVDTTQATNTNRSKLYVNGVQETSFSTANYPAQNLQTFVNHTTYPVRIGRNGWSHTSYFDGYMAEYNFIDGLQLTPSSFGETDVLTGQWNPKKYVGSYGTNGFYLNFSDNSGTTATTLGKDSSGNGNNFTPNNFSVSAGAGNDSLEDTPTNNFATMNPLVPSPSATWANGNLDLAGTSSSQYSQNNTSTFGVSSGKWYVEVKYTNDGTTNTYVGICPITTSATTNLTNNVTDGAVLRMDNTLFIEGSSPSSGTSISSGDIIGIALDMDNQKVWFSVQGTYLSSGNPSTGANATFDGITTGETIAICARPLSGTLNFNFGQRAFSYTPPTGFKKLNSANLPDPTITLPNQHFNTLLYTGNGGSNSITGLQFQPDWLWIKNRGQADNHQLHDAIRGASKGLISNLTNAEYTDVNAVTAFDSNGFSMNNNYDSHNKSSETYVAWNWNAGDTDGKTYTVTVVSDSGNKYRFDGYGTSAVTLDLAEGGTYIFNYPSAHPFRFSETADGTHGGGSEYTTGVTVLSSTSVQIVVAASAPTLYYYCTIHSGMGGAINTNSTLGSSNFDGSKQTVVKANASAGFSIISYTGDGSSGATTGHGLGVAPKIMFHKDRDASNSWYTITTAVDGSADYLYLNSSTSASNSSVTAPTSSLVYFTSSTESNANGRDYIMYAFSEVEGYSKIGKYKGNGSNNGRFVYTGFKVKWLLIKKTNTSEHWILADTKRNSNVGRESPADSYLLASANNAESTGIIYDMLSNGFKFRSTSQNTSGHTYIYLAFAESPYKYARAR